MVRRAWPIFLILSTAACGGTSPAAGLSACGVEGPLGGEACSGLGDCGSGAQNLVEVSFCEHCFARADTHVCEAGVCRALDPASSNVSFRFVVPSEAAAAKSFTIATVNPILADGSVTSCAALFSETCAIDANPKLNARNSRFNALPPGDLISGGISADPGEGRLLVIQLTEGLQGKGRVLARGCATVDVRSGETVGPVSVEVSALEPGSVI